MADRADTAASSTEGPPVARAESVLERSLEWARERSYAGWDPYDGLNSRLLGPFARNWFTRLAILHGVRLAPINLRTVLDVPRQRNPKGIALFASTYLSRYDRTNTDDHLAEAESLLTWLESAQSTAFERPCWGYNFDWQSSRKFYLPAHHPSVVVTVYCGRAFLDHYRLTGNERSRELAMGAGRFLLESINRIEVNGHEAMSYTPYDEFVVVNVNALAGAYLHALAEVGDDQPFRREADALISFVCDAQLPSGAWYYAVPAEESHLGHDNFHTGFVLESLHRVLSTGDTTEAVATAYDAGMDFYRRELFDPGGAPRFEAETRYPYDVHAAAQAIITFARSGDRDNLSMATQVLSWTLAHLYDGTGYFYRHRGRVTTDRTPYMRWSQAWMVRALATYMAAVTED